MTQEARTARPQLVVLAGPNGAGKSTTARLLVRETLKLEQFVDADRIAQGLSPFAPQTVAFQAGRWMVLRIRELLRKGESFAFETTLAGRRHAGPIEEACKRGYVVHLIYLWLHSVELARRRIAIRVARGGHDVPPEVVKRRYRRGLHNFFSLYRPLVDSWTICDNSTEELAIVARGTKMGHVVVVRPTLYERIQRQLPMQTEPTEVRFLENQLELIAEALKKAIRQEVARLRAEGFPVVVERDGRIEKMGGNETTDAGSTPPKTESSDHMTAGGARG